MKTASKKWIAVTAVLCLVAVWLVARHEAGMARDTVSSEDRRAMRTTGLSKQISNGTDQGLDAVSLPTAESIGSPTDMQAGEGETPDLETPDLETQFPEKNEARPAEPGTARAAKEEGMAVPGNSAENPGQTTQAAVASTPAGIQLAPDVRLPVAALPIDFQTNEVTAKMLDLIVDDYYRDLAAGVTQDEEGIQTTRLEDHGESTILVRNGPVAEAARQRADWRFRAIFGKEAFNRMSMQSNLEARLPVATPVNGSE